MTGNKHAVMRDKADRLHNRKVLKTRRKALRNHSTPAEAGLWTLLKHRRFDGLKFRRQHSIGPYILDFYCPAKKLAIELDGAVHNDPMRQEYDYKRNLYLQGWGILVFRCENRALYEDPEGVLEALRHFIQEEGNP